MKPDPNAEEPLVANTYVTNIIGNKMKLTTEPFSAIYSSKDIKTVIAILKTRLPYSAHVRFKIF